MTELGAISESCGRLLGRVMLRREYEEVIPDMPPRSWETITVKIDSAGRKACDLAAKLLKEAGVDLESATGEALGKLGFEAQAHIMATRKVVASAKLPATLELLTSYEASDSAPALLWSAHVAPVEAVGKRKGWTTIRGGTSPSARHEFESRFQAGDFRGAGITIGAGSTALTLTRSWRAFFNDLAWTPSDNDQAAGRNYRISQTRSVLYTSVVADHEVDQRLAELLGAKRDVIDASVRQARVAVGAVPQSAVEQWQAKAAEPAPQHLAYMRPPWRARQEIAKALGRARGLDAATLRSLATAARAGGLSAKQTDLARKICARNGG